MDPGKKLRGGWGVAQGVITIVLIVVGGTSALSVLQTASIAAAFPFMLIMIVMCFSMVKALKEDYETNYLKKVKLPDEIILSEEVVLEENK